MEPSRYINMEILQICVRVHIYRGLNISNPLKLQVLQVPIGEEMKNASSLPAFMEFLSRNKNCSKNILWFLRKLKNATTENLEKSLNFLCFLQKSEWGFLFGCQKEQSFVNGLKIS